SLDLQGTLQGDIDLFLPGRAHGNSVTQKEGEVTLSEGAFLTINCTYTAKGYPELSWYVQYPGESLQLLFRVTKSGEKGSHRGFEATYNRETTSFHLEKATVHKSDSARYYCVLGDTVAETTAGAEHKLSSSRDLAAGCLLWNPSGLSTGFWSPPPSVDSFL
uniref:Ig-like domain-containing protein n=1 Tax=Castor canadensis TaxID=51338 RepID=A0A8C0WGN7_CASCN